jgi:hypothetical protein
MQPGADVAGVRPGPMHIWQGCAQSRCRCGRVRPVPAQMWQGEPIPVPVQMWQGVPSPGVDVAG